jgi:hypothetical protein
VPAWGGETLAVQRAAEHLRGGVAQHVPPGDVHPGDAAARGVLGEEPPLRLDVGQLRQ